MCVFFRYYYYYYYCYYYYYYHHHYYNYHFYPLVLLFCIFYLSIFLSAFSAYFSTFFLSPLIFLFCSFFTLFNYLVLILDFNYCMFSLLYIFPINLCYLFPFFPTVFFTKCELFSFLTFQHMLGSVF